MAATDIIIGDSAKYTFNAFNRKKAFTLLTEIFIYFHMDHSDMSAFHGIFLEIGLYIVIQMQ